MIKLPAPFFIPASLPPGMLAAVRVDGSARSPAIPPLQQLDTAAPMAPQSAPGGSCLALDEYVNSFGPDLPQSWLQHLSATTVGQLMPAAHPDWPAPLTEDWKGPVTSFFHIAHRPRHPAAPIED
ncbi:MAG: hypothetical protein NT154_07510 [Verrucomicrobia bacterium]|nr:hypothetical protein [Verrucomicrobiota bacterium]